MQDIFYISIISKLIACTITYPHVVLRTKIMDNRAKYHGNFTTIKILDVCKEILLKNGIKGFYSGFKIDAFKILPKNTIEFMVYEKTK